MLKIEEYDAFGNLKPDIIEHYNVMDTARLDIAKSSINTYFP